jgi:hypothetical protein
MASAAGQQTAAIGFNARDIGVYRGLHQAFTWLALQGVGLG